MTRDKMAAVMEMVFKECCALRSAGQKEYAHKEDNAFANFERTAERTGMTREQVLLVFMEKHIDGVHAWVKGYRSQRESVTGRINDIIVYCCLLRGMVESDRYKQGVATVCQEGDHHVCDGNTCVGECACDCHADGRAPLQRAV